VHLQVITFRTIKLRLSTRDRANVLQEHDVSTPKVHVVTRFVRIIQFYFVQDFFAAFFFNLFFLGIGGVKEDVEFIAVVCKLKEKSFKKIYLCIYRFHSISLFELT
jgi:hypothetical protein